jgi:hypothetical protein
MGITGNIDAPGGNVFWVAPDGIKTGLHNLRGKEAGQAIFSPEIPWGEFSPFNPSASDSAAPLGLTWAATFMIGQAATLFPSFLPCLVSVSGYSPCGWLLLVAQESPNLFFHVLRG